MRKFFTETTQKKVLIEMAAPKMPEGVSRKRHKTYAFTHDIHIGGEHVATISGHTPDRRDRYEKGVHQGGGYEHSKQYTIHKSMGNIGADGYAHNETHPDHSAEVERHEYGNGYSSGPTSTKKIRVPHVHGSMEAAVEAVHLSHSLKNKFGNLSQTERWHKAASMREELNHHSAKSSNYRQAHSALKALGHDDLAGQVQVEHEKHIATKPHSSEHDISALSHDAGQASYDKDHPHHELARKATGRNY